MKFKTFMIAAGQCFMAATLPLSAQENAVFTDSPDLAYDATWGTSRAERYDVAVCLSFPRLEGAAVESVSFPWLAPEGASDVRIWLSETLKVENKLNVPDVVEMEAVCADGKATATFAEPYRIGPGGVYAGMSFTIDAKDTETQKAPVAAVKGDDMFGTGFWVHTSSTYANRWKNLVEDYGETPVFEASISGVPARAVAISASGEYYTVADESVEVPVKVVSYGSGDIRTLTITESDATSEGNELTVDLGESNRFYFGYPVDRTLSIPGGAETGRREIGLSVGKVDGEDNTLAAEGGEITLFICSSRPMHRPLFEEYTGTGCGYCPRGALGMEKLTEMYGDRFVGVAYHVSDVMSIADVADYPNYAPAQPDAFIDRYVKTDPYFGESLSKMEFLVPEVWQAQEEIFSPVHFDLTCDWADDAREQLDVRADFSFVRDYADADFRIAYILMSNGLKGAGQPWMQANYYSGETGRWPGDFDVFVNSTRYMPDMTYDHVAIAMPEKDGVEGSVPSDIRANIAMNHSYSMLLSEAVNLQGQSLVQDKDNIYVVAAILDAATGHVLNCAKAVPGVMAVDGIESDAEPVSVEYVTLQGQRTAGKAYGQPMIELRRYSDGKVITRKLLP
ncbi:MAG: hypothetical protein HDR47_06810 [Bacteroides sp.]|nr:hypothetical protein [Bacteroides sp.]